MRCTKCGSENEEGATQCRRCGSALEDPLAKKEAELAAKNKRTAPTRRRPEDESHSVRNIIIAIVVAIVVVAGIALGARFLAPSGDTSSSSSSSESGVVVTFDSRGGSKVEAQTATDAGKVTKPENPTRKGYVFVGWYTDQKLTKKVKFPFTATQDTTLYAKWAKKSEATGTKKNGTKKNGSTSGGGTSTSSGTSGSGGGTGTSGSGGGTGTSGSGGTSSGGTSSGGTSTNGGGNGSSGGGTGTSGSGGTSTSSGGGTSSGGTSSGGTSSGGTSTYVHVRKSTNTKSVGHVKLNKRKNVRVSVITINGRKLSGIVHRNKKGYVIGNSSRKTYTFAGLRKLDLNDAELCIARNEIYARLGYEFSVSGLQKYFESCSWYKNKHRRFELNDSTPGGINAIKLLKIAKSKKGSRRWCNLLVDLK